MSQDEKGCSSSSEDPARSAVHQTYERMPYPPQISRFLASSAATPMASNLSSSCRIDLPDDVLPESSSAVVSDSPSILGLSSSRRRSTFSRRMDLHLHSSSTPRTPPSPPTDGSPGPWHGRSLDSTPRHASSLFADSAGIVATPVAQSLKGDCSDSWMPNEFISQQTTLPRRANSAAKLDQPMQLRHLMLDDKLLNATSVPNSLVSLSSSGNLASTHSFKGGDFLRTMPEIENECHKPSEEVMEHLSTVSVSRLWEEAITLGDEQSIVELLNQGFNLDLETMSLKVCPLILAVKSGNENIVKLLLAAGAEINSVDEKHLTALHYAASAGQWNLVKLLVVAGADIYAKSEKGLFPFQLSSDKRTRHLLTLQMRSDMESRTPHSHLNVPDSAASVITKQGFLGKDPSKLHRNSSSVNVNKEDTMKHPAFLDQELSSIAFHSSPESSVHDIKSMEAEVQRPVNANLVPHLLKRHDVCDDYVFQRRAIASVFNDTLNMPSHNVSALTQESTGSSILLENVEDPINQVIHKQGSNNSSPKSHRGESFQHISPFSPKKILDNRKSGFFESTASKFHNTSNLLPLDAQASFVSLNSPSGIGLRKQIMSSTMTGKVISHTDHGYITSRQIATGTVEQYLPLQQDLYLKSSHVDQVITPSDAVAEEDKASISGNQKKNNCPVMSEASSTTILIDHFSGASELGHSESDTDLYVRNKEDIMEEKCSQSLNVLEYVRNSMELRKATGCKDLSVQTRISEEPETCIQLSDERNDEHTNQPFVRSNLSQPPETHSSTFQDSCGPTFHDESCKQSNLVSVRRPNLKNLEENKFEKALEVTRESEKYSQQDKIFRDSGMRSSLIGIDTVLKESQASSSHVVQMELPIGDSTGKKDLEYETTEGDLMKDECSKGLSNNEDQGVLKIKSVEKLKERKVKFAFLEDDLMLIRKDWHDAARAGCTGCGKEGCDGQCLPQNVGYQERTEYSENASSLTVKQSFFEIEGKQAGSFHWTKGELLGEGAYGKVFAGLNQSTGELIAVKQLKINDPTDDQEKALYLSSLEREISFYKKLRHKHIVGYLGMEKDEASGSLFIFLEYVSGGSIQSMLERFGPFREELVRVYTRQLLMGLEYLHQNKIVHRDIKGGNVLVDSNGIVKLGDFGASKAFHDPAITDGCKSIRGSIFWMAPEVIKGDGYGRRADVWSVGCTVIEMFTAMHPWPTIENTWSAIFHIAKATTGPPTPETGSECARDFLAECFKINPKLRPTASELLQHPFVAAVEPSSKSSVDD